MASGSKGTSTVLIAKIIGVAAIVLFIAGLVIKPYVWGHTFTGVVADKQVKRSVGTDIYLIAIKVEGQKDIQTFKNTDCWWRFKFSSSDYQANIQKDKRYKFKTLGIRFGPTSSYPNIIDYEEIKE